jgi:putative two-component system response regulator
VASLLIAPVHEDGALLGVLVLGGVGGSDHPARHGVLRAIAVQAGRSLVRACANVALSRSQRQTVERLTRAAEFRDEETANHNQRVGRYSALLASLYGLDERRTELIAAASAMHDIGKLGIPDNILRKAGPLTPTERLHMQRHAEYGHRILTGENDPLLDLAATIALTHHERWDGQGYPYGIAGTDIPLEGRIVAIGDVFDALTSDRVYRPAMSVEDALRHMREGRGTHFDPQLLDLFIDALPQVLAIRRRHPDRASEPAASTALR